jgi:cytosol alanyl aminopeptidase
MLHAVALPLLLAAAEPAFKPPELRLPGDVRPLHQSIELTVDPDSTAFEGAVEIELEVVRETPVVWLNASALTVAKASIGPVGSPAGARLVPGGADFVGIVPEHPLPAGRALLRASFTGTVDRQRTDGVFAMKEGTDWYVFTQFEAIAARRAFPCFDEPSYKIPWQVSLRVPAGRPAFSNTPIASTTREGSHDLVRFAATRPLPSYLVAFAVGPFETVDLGTIGRNRTPARLVVPRGRSTDTAWARESTPRILSLLEEYFDRPYPYEKLDQLAIPGVGYAMEHPGLVTYGMGLMVQREKEQTIDSRRSWVSVAAHELAHQWFGDLVTMAWWDDTWLNESFASWMGEKVTDRFRPEWGTALERVSGRSGALETDSLATARRIRQPIASLQDIEDAFDGITYAKGEAVLEMAEAWLGEDAFRRGVQSHLDRHAWGNATAADFLGALSMAAGRDVSLVLSTFLDQTGAPVVSADVRCDASPLLVLRQRPYRALGSSAAPKAWQLPVCARVAGGGRACGLLTQAEGSLALGGAVCPEWAYANAGGAGYYRTLLSSDQARRALAGLSPAERLALAGDLRAFVSSADVEARDALSLARTLASDQERRVVSASVGLLEDLEPVVDDTKRDRYRAFVRSLFADRARAAGLAPAASDSEDVRLLRRSLVRAAAVVGRDPALQRDAVERLRRWLDDPASVDADMLGLVLAVGGGAADRALVDRLRAEVLREADRERRQRLLQAVGSVRDPALAREVLALTLDEHVDAREGIGVLWRITGSLETRRTAFDFVEQNYDALVARLPKGMFSPVSYLPFVGAAQCSPESRRETEAFFRPRLAAVEGSARTLAQALERADQCIALRAAQRASVTAFLDALPAAGAAR